MKSSTILNRNNFLIFSGTIALFSLAYAFYAQYFENVNPCILCLYERYFYMGTIACGLLGFARSLRNYCYSLTGLILISGLGLAIYHLGVENHWWQGTAACHGVTSQAKSIEELRALLQSKPMGRCDQPGWYIFGISATYLNLIWFSGFFGLWTVVRQADKC